MKKIIIFLLILSSVSCSSQKLSEIKKQNTFFILFEDSEFAKRLNTIPKILEPTHYTFYDNDKNGTSKKPSPYWFVYDKYENLEDAKKDKQTISYRIHKSFLRKNKGIILTKKDLENLGELNVVRLFEYNKKNIFIIDKNETKNNEILIRKVKFIYTAYE